MTQAVEMKDNLVDTMVADNMMSDYDNNDNIPQIRQTKELPSSL